MPHVYLEGNKMEINGVTVEQLNQAIRDVNGQFGYNLTTAYTPQELNQKGTRLRFRLRSVSSRDNGARTSWSGRRTPSACWHAHRDLFRHLFRTYGDKVRIRTSMANYTYSNFETTYPDTGDVNIGSMISPAFMPELCQH